MSNQTCNLVQKLLEIQAQGKQLDEKRAKMIDDLCASILAVFADSKKD